MNILMFSPAFPAEMPRFTQGLAEVGVRVFGLSDAPESMLPDSVQRLLTGYVRVPSLWDEEAVVRAVLQSPFARSLDRVECLWEPGMLVAARLREALGLPGMTVEQTIPFRDKGEMKKMLDAAGLRTPRHHRAATEYGCRAAAEEIGYPLIIKPIAGAGSADTYRLDGSEDMDRVLPRLRHVPEVSVEEFIDGEEYTFDTITSGGHVHFHNVAWYRPKPLEARAVQWISPQTVTLRDLDSPELKGGIELGLGVLKALGFETGFTHMEWFRQPDGEVVFGEIGGRPPGARSVDLMMWANDLNIYRGWAEAVAYGRFTQSYERRYNSAVIFKRAQGEGRIQRVEGLEELRREFGSWLVEDEISQVGQPRRNWKQTLVSDGYLILRHPDLPTLMEMADRVGTDLQLYAG